MNKFMTTLLSALSLGASHASWSPEVSMDLKVVNDVQVSPDNSEVLFVVTKNELGEIEGKQSTVIYRCRVGEEPEGFTQEGVTSNQPKWSPDGKAVAFTSDRSGVNQLYLLSRNGREASQLTSGDEKVETYAWSQDGTRIAFTRKEKLGQEQKKSKSYLFGAMDKITRLFVLDIRSKECVAVTDDNFSVRGEGDFGGTNVEFDWSPDGEEITFAYAPSADVKYFYVESHIAKVNVKTKKITPWEIKTRLEAMPRYSPDGSFVTYLVGGESKFFGLHRDFHLRTSDGAYVRSLAETPNGGPFLRGVNLVGWNKEGTGIYYFEPQGTKYHMIFVPIDGSDPQVVDTKGHFFKEPHISQDNTHVGFVKQSLSEPPEVYISSLENFEPVKLTSFNESFLSLPKIKTENVSWNSVDGEKIEGLLTYPLNYTPQKKYPLLLVIHGGPIAFFDETFVGAPFPYPTAAFAEEGFFVFRPNPRGSTGYGKKFRDILYQDLGGVDYDDLMSGVDSLIDKGLVDKDRMGVMGWSYGGYMTGRVISKTNRFKAASAGAGLYNMLSMSGTMDVSEFIEGNMGSFHENIELYHDRSAVNYVNDIETPLLLEHGTKDFRVPLSQSREFYHVLDRAGKEVYLKLYPEMGHNLSDPNMLLDSMHTNLEWFKDRV